MSSLRRRPRLALAREEDAVRNAFAADVARGLSSSPKSLPCRYFYDAAGSALFEDITRLPEYYPTATEARILSRHAATFAGSIPDDSIIVEFGSGSSTKTELLLRALPSLRAYVPIDVSESALSEAAARLAAAFPTLDMRPVVGDFTQALEIPPDLAHLTPIGFFPGSTIGNFAPREAEGLLRAFRATLSDRGRLLIGVDLRKDVQTLLNAYDDSSGVTAAFNLNLLARINRELGGTFDLARFRHKVRYDFGHGRIEMHLASTCDQVVRVGEHTYRFRTGETIHTENSHKFTIEQFHGLAMSAGWHPLDVWLDDDELFSVHDLAAA